MPTLPNPWIILGAVLAIIGVAIGGFFYGQHVEALAWEAAIATQKAEAAQIVNAHNQHMAALNLEIEHAHNQRQAALTAGAADSHRLAGELDRLRLSRRGACGGDQVQPAPGVAVPQPRADSAGSVAGSFSEMAAIANDAVATAEYAAACRAWVEGLPK
jgi:hypothetical protein